MRLRYYDKHGAEIQVGMLLRHDGGAIERVLEGVNSSGDITLGFEASASEIYPLSEFNLKEWEFAAARPQVGTFPACGCYYRHLYNPLYSSAQRNIMDMSEVQLWTI